MRKLSGTQREGEGARRARLRAGAGPGEAVGTRAHRVPGSAEEEGSEGDLRFRGGEMLEAGAGEAADELAASDVAREVARPAPPLAPTLASGSPGAETAFAARQVLLWRVRLEATPKRRPQPEQTKAGGRGAGSGVSSEAERSVGGRGG